MSALDRPSDKVNGLNAGAVEYINKPLNLPFLTSRVCYHLNGPVVPSLPTLENKSYEYGYAPIEIASDTRELTFRENQVMGYMVGGHSNKSIAIKLLITDVTVRLHVRNIFRKLGVHNRVQAVMSTICNDHPSITH